MGLRIVPVSLRDAGEYVAVWHRHHPRPPRGHKFSLGVCNAQGYLVGVAIVGRPVARGLDDARTLEVTRLATDGTANACSKLYGAAWRATRALGYDRLVTYTQHGESGASLRAAGWRPAAALPPRESWNRPGAAGSGATARMRWEAP
ncbi:hypothetical protein F4561_001471 [Lipingzhangella halophila]|uniref:N-acetyltransferase domain-containing protein n=1 Tax=Lipingzhangella halophila TaxID=1783352 RepID=A0A7W7REV1_9ACTN|nr:XF1762 family protein [Lipingzhangella halophila]MBB4930651.1 hypothetical protein [Lipingzhangella halophila]